MAFTPNFVFADQVPAQQAVQYAQLAAQQQAQQDQAFNDRLRNATQGRIAQQNSDQQRMMNQYQMMNSAAERQKDRESNQTIAGIQAGRVNGGGTFDERLKAQQAADAAAKHDDQKNKHLQGVALAKILINPNVPESEKIKVRETALKSGLLTVNPRGYYMPSFADPDVQVSVPGAPIENIDQIMKRSMVPSQSNGGVPSRGNFINRPVSSMSQPRFSDFPSAPPGPSPFEPDGFQVFRQSDFTNPPEVPADQPWMQPSY